MVVDAHRQTLPQPVVFSGRMLSDTAYHLGEGPVCDPRTGIVWWVDILEKQLIAYNPSNAQLTDYHLPFMASFVGLVDDSTQLLGTEHGLYLRNLNTGELKLHVAIEADDLLMRSNDGRVHPSGALWIGTMRKAPADPSGGGTIYHVAGKTVTPLFLDVGIPNGICFSPNGTKAYYADLRVNIYRQVSLDPVTGLPNGTPTEFADTRDWRGGIDGSVCDIHGHIWNARAGAGTLHEYAPNGLLVGVYQMPARLVTCPVFAGASAQRLLMTSGFEGLGNAERRSNPDAGKTFDTGLQVEGRFEPSFKSA